MTVAAVESPPVAATAPDAASAFFAMRNVHSYYGESYIVQGVSLELRKGEILALLGRNGAGKTSTLRTIARVSEPELRSGEIWLEGKPIHTMKSFQAAQSGIQLVPEDRRIIPGMTVEENHILARWPRSRVGSDKVPFSALDERRTQEVSSLRGRAADACRGARAVARGQAPAAR